MPDEPTTVGEVYAECRELARRTLSEPHLVEASPVRPGVRRVGYSDGSHADIALPAVETAGELITFLSLLPAATPVLASGYEGGFTSLSVDIADLQELDRHGDCDYLGSHEAVAEARRQAALAATDHELAVGGITPPTLIGEPVTSVVLGRRGR